VGTAVRWKNRRSLHVLTMSGLKFVEPVTPGEKANQEDGGPRLGVYLYQQVLKG